MFAVHWKRGAGRCTRDVLVQDLVCVKDIVDDTARVGIKNEDFPVAVGDVAEVGEDYWGLH